MEKHRQVLSHGGVEADERPPCSGGFPTVQQDGRANHLPIVEAWRSAETQRAHTMAEYTRAFRAKLVPLQGALYDERLYALIR